MNNEQQCESLSPLSGRAAGARRRRRCGATAERVRVSATLKNVQCIRLSLAWQLFTPRNLSSLPLVQLF